MLGKHLEALADHVEVLKLEPSLGTSWFRKGLAIERLVNMSSNWSMKRNSFGDAKECFGRADELGFKNSNYKNTIADAS